MDLLSGVGIEMYSIGQRFSISKFLDIPVSPKQQHVAGLILRVHFIRTSAGYRRATFGNFLKVEQRAADRKLEAPLTCDITA